MTKRFCDLCDTEIAVTERFYDVLMTVKSAAHGEDGITNRCGEFCYHCVKSGKGLSALYDRYQKETA